MTGKESMTGAAVRLDTARSRDSAEPHLGIRLFARIRKSSKYAYQNRMAEEHGWGLPFAVSVEPAEDGYVISGGPGGRYRKQDVILIVMVDGLEVAIS